MMNTRLILLLLALTTGVLRAQNVSGTLIPFQGRLTDQLGLPRTNGTYTLVFNLYDQAVGGSNLWTERHERVGVINGMVNVFLGSITPLDTPAPGVDFSSTRYLGITIDADNNSNTSDPEMVPRQMIIPAFWAKNSDNSRLLAGASWSSILDSGNNPETGFIRGSKLKPGSIGPNQLQTSAIASTHIADQAVTFQKRALRRVATGAGAQVGEIAVSSTIDHTVSLDLGWQTFAGSEASLVTSGGPVIVSVESVTTADEDAHCGLFYEFRTSSREVDSVVALFVDGKQVANQYFKLERVVRTDSVTPSSFIFLPFSMSVTLNGLGVGSHSLALRVKTRNQSCVQHGLGLRNMKVIAYEP